MKWHSMIDPNKVHEHIVMLLDFLERLVNIDESITQPAARCADWLARVALARHLKPEDVAGLLSACAISLKVEREFPMIVAYFNTRLKYYEMENSVRPV